MQQGLVKLKMTVVKQQKTFLSCLGSARLYLGVSNKFINFFC